jgi:hypothetical protein
MKLLLVIYSGANRQLVPALFDQHHVDGYTAFDRAHGQGLTGKRVGTRAWPDDASIYFSVVAGRNVDELTQAFRQAASVLDAGERLHVAVLPTETFF